MKYSTDIKIKDFYYDLPDSRIAKRPLDERDKSKLLYYRQGKISSMPFCSLSDVLPENNLLIRNNTRVIQARLNFKKSTGANIEIFCLEPIKPKSYELNFAASNSVEWVCMIGNAKKWKNGSLEQSISFNNKVIVLKVLLIDRLDKQSLIRFEWQDENISFADILEKAGSTPIPPYLNRQARKEDKEWYQTVYAQLNGSVAAPTAGLHFTDNVFKALRNKSIDIEEVTLHVGAGTFRPVQSAKISDHLMHVESLLVNKNSISKLIKYLDKGITAIGTTSLRTLESLYWLGRKLAKNPDTPNQDLNIEQWEPYNNIDDIPTSDSLEAILEYLKIHKLSSIEFSTRLIIVPGYKFRLVNRLITNFHQPGSTLLLLVAAFIGDDWREVYKYALNNEFRFLSYGDSSILERNNSIIK